MPLDTGDQYDKPLSPGANFIALNSLHLFSDSITTKHSRKGSFTISLDD